MYYPFIAVFFAGCIITTGFIGSYLIQRKQFNLKPWLNISLLAIGIGALFTQLLCAGYPAFSTAEAVTIGAIIHFGVRAKENEKLEQTLVSALGGVLIGLTSLVGFIMYC